MESLDDWRAKLVSLTHAQRRELFDRLDSEAVGLLRGGFILRLFLYPFVVVRYIRFATSVGHGFVRSMFFAFDWSYVLLFHGGAKQSWIGRVLNPRSGEKGAG